MMKRFSLSLTHGQIHLHKAHDTLQQTQNTHTNNLLQLQRTEAHKHGLMENYDAANQTVLSANDLLVKAAVGVADLGTMVKKALEASNVYDNIVKYINEADESSVSTLNMSIRTEDLHDVEEKKPVNVSTNIMRVRELIAQARSVASKVQVSMKFNGQSSVELHPPVDVDQLMKAVTSISLYVRVDPDSDPIEDRFLLYLGDKNVSVIYHQSKKVILLVDRSFIKSTENEKKTLPFNDIYIGGVPSHILHSRPEFSSLLGLKGCVKGFQFQKKDFNLLEEPGTIGISSGCPEESFCRYSGYITVSGSAYIQCRDSGTNSGGFGYHNSGGNAGYITVSVFGRIYNSCRYYGYITV
ncbi:Laminin subunit alpha-4 [Bagarius yarrelli]|uniref:Laminin subunit alpha-4 n=1 Tax=Bagarius yarrelli TaxID=175774 RepID=A0A556VWV7_BAGYA|nr:Laminin subunit alpha-4 [Bagarius yarrelli]